MFDKRWVRSHAARAAKAVLDGLCENDLIDAPQAELERGVRDILERAILAAGRTRRRKPRRKPK